MEQSCRLFSLHCKASGTFGALTDHVSGIRLLMFASGIPTAENPTAKRYFLLSNGTNAKEENKEAWPKYKEYLRSTSILIPMPPALYRPLPSIIKTTLLMDFPMYRFDERTDGPQAIEEDKKSSQN